MRKILNLKGKTAVFIDWANVYGWKKSLGRVVDHDKLHNYLQRYKEVKSINFYYGEDKHPKSKIFLKAIKKVGYKLVSKPVKYICVGQVGKQRIFDRKCDFDMEICIDVHKYLQEDFKSFIFFTGDGDFAPLYKLLINAGRQVVVIYASGHIGREIWEINKGLFKAKIEHLGL